MLPSHGAAFDSPNERGVKLKDSPSTHATERCRIVRILLLKLSVICLVLHDIAGSERIDLKVDLIACG